MGTARRARKLHVGTERRPPGDGISTAGRHLQLSTHHLTPLPSTHTHARARTKTHGRSRARIHAHTLTPPSSLICLLEAFHTSSVNFTPTMLQSSSFSVPILLSCMLHTDTSFVARTAHSQIEEVVFDTPGRFFSLSSLFTYFSKLRNLLALPCNEYFQALKILNDDVACDIIKCGGLCSNKARATFVQFDPMRRSTPLSAHRLQPFIEPHFCRKLTAQPQTQQLCIISLQAAWAAFTSKSDRDLSFC
eukprot:6187783-Pleurochrysis_carterae.AAC.1